MGTCCLIMMAPLIVFLVYQQEVAGIDMQLGTSSTAGALTVDINADSLLKNYFLAIVLYYCPVKQVKCGQVLQNQQTKLYIQWSMDAVFSVAEAIADACNRFCSVNTTECNLAAWNNGSIFTPEQVFFPEVNVQPELNAIRLQVLVHFNGLMEFPDDFEFEPMLSKAALSAIFRSHWPSIEDDSGWDILLFEPVPKYDQLTNYMNYFLVPGGLIIILLFILLAKCSTFLTTEHEVYWQLRTQRKRIEAKRRRLATSRLSRPSIFSMHSRGSSSEYDSSGPPSPVTRTHIILPAVTLRNNLDQKVDNGPRLLAATSLPGIPSVLAPVGATRRRDLEETTKSTMEMNIFTIEEDGVENTISATELHYPPSYKGALPEISRQPQPTPSILRTASKRRKMPSKDKSVSLDLDEIENQEPSTSRRRSGAKPSFSTTSSAASNRELLAPHEIFEKALFRRRGSLYGPVVMPSQNPSFFASLRMRVRRYHKAKKRRIRTPQSTVRTKGRVVRTKMIMPSFGGTGGAGAGAGRGRMKMGII